ncbi:type II secretion system protein J [Chloroflexota bacterium]
MRQKGFTLIEVLVVLAVGSVITMGTVLTFYQIVWGAGRSNSQIVASTDANQAALRVRKDLMMAHNTDMTDNVSQSGSVLLTWTDLTGDNYTDHSISYVLSGTELQRDYDGVVSITGRHITDITFIQDGRVVNVAITATGSGTPQRSVTLDFDVYKRAEVLE